MSILGIIFDSSNLLKIENHEKLRINRENS